MGRGRMWSGKEDSAYIKIYILGHANYAQHGKDIVCSAVSSIVTTTINGILALNEGSLNYEVSKKGMIIEGISRDSITQRLLESMVSLLKQLEEQYPANIEIQ